MHDITDQVRQQKSYTGTRRKGNVLQYIMVWILANENVWLQKVLRRSIN